MNPRGHNLDAVPPPQASRPLFVLSVPRSGSTLLYALLNQHSQISLLYEGDLPTMQLYLFGRLRSGAWRERWEFWNQAPSRHGIAIESMPARVSNVWEATKIVYQGVARRKRATIWGEKTPQWYHCALRTAEKFPDASFIFLWRDMQAVMGSIARAAVTERLFRKEGFANRALLGNEQLKRACEALKSRGRHVHEVDYEDLASNSSECMRQICQFLKLPFESQVASLEGTDLTALTRGQHHALVRSNRIVGPRKYADILPQATAAKSGRYICYWRRRYGGKWPKYPLELPEGTRPASLVERLRDRFTYERLLLWDKIVIVIYAITPLCLARLWRQKIRPRVYPRKYTSRPSET
ncbi:MAG: sulfotransferase family protein [Terriglobales bacterium]